MIENDKYKTTIEYKDLQQKILDYITSGEIDKMISKTVFDGDEKCRSAIIHGMCMASLIASSCNQICVFEVD